MKTWGIILIALGSFSVIIGIVRAVQGFQASFGGVVFIVLGAYLLSRAKKKKEEAEKKRNWEQQS